MKKAILIIMAIGVILSTIGYLAMSIITRGEEREKNLNDLEKARKAKVDKAKEKIVDVPHEVIEDNGSEKTDSIPSQETE